MVLYPPPSHLLFIFLPQTQLRRTCPRLRCERCSHETISSFRHFYLFFFRKHTCARLPPVTHPPTPRSCRESAVLMRMNKKRILLGKQPRVPSPPLAIYSYYSYTAVVQVLYTSSECDHENNQNTYINT